jgi:hypothetical protein
MRYAVFSVNDHHPRLARTVQNFGALAPYLVERSMKLFAQEEMPQVESPLSAKVSVP